MFKSRFCFISLAVILFTNWFVVFPLLVCKPEKINSGVLDGIPSFWIPYVFCGGASIILIIPIFILWCVMCCVQKRRSKVVDDNSKSTELVTIQSESSKKLKDRVEIDEMIIEPCKSNAEAYRDIQNIFLQRKNSELKCHTATQTTGRLPSSPTDYVANEVMTGLNSCDGCSQIIDDDKVVNIFMNKTWTSENEMDELVPQAKPRVKRFHIYENMTPMAGAHPKVLCLSQYNQKL